MAQGRIGALAVALTVAAGLLIPAGSSAISIGEGQVPGLAIADDGTGYIAWKGPGTPSALRFCRLPRGGSACDPAATATVAAPGDSVSRPFVFSAGGTVVIVQSRYGEGVPGFSALYAFVSTDGGTAFGPGTVIGDASFADAVVGPGATVSGVTNAQTGGTVYQAAPLVDPPLAPDGTSTVGSALLSADRPYDGSVAVIDQTTPIATFADGNGDHQFRVYTGSGDVNDVANWTAATALGSYGTVKLASGPTGTFMIGTTTAAPDYELLVRKFDGTTFGAPSPLGITGNPSSTHAFEDGAGRLHVVTAAADAEGQHVRYGISDDGKTWRWGTVVTQATATAGGVGDLRVAAAPDHIGLAAWSGGSGNGEVRVTAVGPEPVPAPTLGKTANVWLLAGQVRIRPPAGRKLLAVSKGAGFVPLQQERQIPIGSLIDARRGTLRLAAAVDQTDTTQEARITGGVFTVTQKQRGVSKGLTTFALKLGAFKGAPSTKQCRGKAGAASAAKLSKKQLQTLRASDKGGKFRTRGRFSAGTVRGTVWSTIERCDGTLTKVKRGAVAVTDFTARRVITVRAGHRHLARPG